MTEEAAHKLVVERLNQNGDWAGLVRYWIAHKLHSPAIEAAVDVVTLFAHSDGSWNSIVNYISEFRDKAVSLIVKPPDGLPQVLSYDESETIEALACFSRASIALHIGPNDESDREIYYIACESCEDAVRIGGRVDDLAFGAAMTAFHARISVVWRDGLRARVGYEIAIEAYERLVNTRPEIYYGYLVEAMAGVGHVFHLQGDLKEARIHLENAFKKQNESVPTASRGIFDYWALLNELAQVCQGLDQLEDAVYYRELFHSERKRTGNNQSDEAQLDIAVNLGQLASLQQLLGRWSEAEKNHVASLLILRALGSGGHKLYQPLIAASLHNMSLVFCAQDCFDSGRDALIEAAGIWRTFCIDSPNI